MKIIFREGVRTLYEADAVTIEPEHPAKEHADPQFLIETAGQIGWHLGKWIYLIDAVDDIEENLKNGSYNPLLYRFSYDASSETPEAFRNRIEPGSSLQPVPLPGHCQQQPAGAAFAEKQRDFRKHPLPGNEPQNRGNHHTCRKEKTNINKRILQ